MAGWFKSLLAEHFSGTGLCKDRFRGAFCGTICQKTKSPPRTAATLKSENTSHSLWSPWGQAKDSLELGSSWHKLGRVPGQGVSDWLFVVKHKAEG